MTGSDDVAIAVIARPGNSDAYAEPIYRFLDVLEPAAGQIHLLAGDAVCESSRVRGHTTSSLGDGAYTSVSILDYLILQIFSAWLLFRIRTETDVVYLQKGAMGFVLPVVTARLLGLPVCVIKVGAYAGDREGGPVGWSSRLLDWLQRSAFRCATAVVVFTESERASVPCSRTYVSYSNYRDFDHWRATSSFRDREFTVGFVGRFVSLKGVDTVADAVERLLDTDDSRSACLVGDGPKFDAVAEQLGDNENITLPGWVDPDDLPSWLSEVKLLVMPSRAEGLPTTVVEGMGCESVVVATAVGSIPDLMTDGETGFILETGDVEDLVTTCERLLARDDLGQIGARARERVAETYSLSAAQERFQRITRELSTN